MFITILICISDRLFSKIFPRDHRSKRSRDGPNKHAVPTRATSSVHEECVDAADRRFVVQWQRHSVQPRSTARQTDKRKIA